MNKNKKKRIIKELGKILEDLITSIIVNFLIFWLVKENHERTAWNIIRVFFLIFFSATAGRYARYYWKWLLRNE